MNLNSVSGNVTLSGNFNLSVVGVPLANWQAALTWKPDVANPAEIDPPLAVDSGVTKPLSQIDTVSQVADAFLNNVLSKVVNANVLNLDNFNLGDIASFFQTAQEITPVLQALSGDLGGEVSSLLSTTGPIDQAASGPSAPGQFKAQDAAANGGEGFDINTTSLTQLLMGQSVSGGAQDLLTYSDSGSLGSIPLVPPSTETLGKQEAGPVTFTEEASFGVRVTPSYAVRIGIDTHGVFVDTGNTYFTLRTSIEGKATLRVDLLGLSDSVNAGNIASGAVGVTGGPITKLTLTSPASGTKLYASDIAGTDLTKSNGLSSLGTWLSNLFQVSNSYQADLVAYVDINNANGVVDNFFDGLLTKLGVSQPDQENFNKGLDALQTLEADTNYYDPKFYTDKNPIYHAIHTSVIAPVIKFAQKNGEINKITGGGGGGGGGSAPTLSISDYLSLVDRVAVDYLGLFQQPHISGDPDIDPTLQKVKGDPQPNPPNGNIARGSYAPAMDTLHDLETMHRGLTFLTTTSSPSSNRAGSLYVWAFPLAGSDNLTPNQVNSTPNSPAGIPNRPDLIPITYDSASKSLTIQGNANNDTVQLVDLGNGDVRLYRSTRSVDANGNVSINVDPTVDFPAGVSSVNATFLNGNNVFTMDSTLTANATVTAGSGNNSIQTGSGNDTVTINNTTNPSANNSIDVGDGNNTVTGGMVSNDTIEGGIGTSHFVDGNGNDHLVGGTGYSYLEAGGGNNVIQGGQGNNTLIAGDGTNTFIGGTGNETMTAGNGANTIYAGTGDDTIVAGSGANIIYTGLGNDNITTGNGADTIIVQDEDLSQIGGARTDTIQEGGGINLLAAEGGTYVHLATDTPDSASSKAGVAVMSDGSGNSLTVNYTGVNTLAPIGMTNTTFSSPHGGHNLSVTVPTTGPLGSPQRPARWSCLRHSDRQP